MKSTGPYWKWIIYILLLILIEGRSEVVSDRNLAMQSESFVYFSLQLLMVKRGQVSKSFEVYVKPR